MLVRAYQEGYKEYLLSAQSATPGIDTSNLRSIFEEHFVATTLDDAIAALRRHLLRLYSTRFERS